MKLSLQAYCFVRGTQTFSEVHKTVYLTYKSHVEHNVTILHQLSWTVPSIKKKFHEP